MLLSLSKPEANLMKAIIALEFGKLLDVEIEHQTERTESMELTVAQVKLVNTIRSGVQQFDEIQCHMKDPQYADGRCEVLGFKAIKKYKFN